MVRSPCYLHELMGFDEFVMRIISMIMCFIEWDLTVFSYFNAGFMGFRCFSWYLDVGNGDVDQ